MATALLEYLDHLAVFFFQKHSYVDLMFVTILVYLLECNKNKSRYSSKTKISPNFHLFLRNFLCPYLYKNFAGKISIALLYCLVPYDQTLGIP